MFFRRSILVSLPWVTYTVRSALRSIIDVRVCPGSPTCGPPETDCENLVPNGELILDWTSGFT